MEKSKMGRSVDQREKTNRQEAWATHPSLAGFYRGAPFSFPRDEADLLQNSHP